MTRVRTALLLPALLLGASACGGDDSASEQAPAEGGSTAEDQGANANSNEYTVDDLAFTAPEGMEDVTDDNPSEADLVLQYPDQREESDPTLQVFPGTSNQVVSGPTALGPEIQAIDPDADIAVQDNFSVDGAAQASLLKADYISSYEETPAKQWAVFIATEGTTHYIVRFGAPASDFDEEGMQNMVDTMSIESAD